MIYTGLNRTGAIGDIKTHGGGEIAEVYGGIGESNPIYYKQREIIGTSPMQFKALGLPLKDYLISGNTIQNGTPTPEAPVNVVGCGVRTENLFDASMTFEAGYINSEGNIVVANMMVHTKDYIPIKNGSQYVLTGKLVPPAIMTSVAMYDAQKNFITRSAGSRGQNRLFFTTTDNCSYVRFNANDGYNNFHYDPNTIMLNSGSTPLPYEPYGYKLPLAVNGTEYPIYLGQVETTRRIKKLVLTGEEDWKWQSGQTVPYFRLSGTVMDGITGQVVCTHYVSPDSVISTSNMTRGIRVQDSTNYGRILIIRTPTNATDTVSDFKSYLAAQYAAGTPVTVWYVLAEPETGIVNGPLHKIGNYADTISFAQAGVTIPTVSGANVLDVPTEVPPSEIDLTGRIKTS